jgi:GDPmannose 4,6-dehydratase
MERVALVTGITGQDGAYLSKLLLEKGYKVLGGKRRQANHNLWRLDRLGITKDVELVEFDLADYISIQNILKNYKIDEFYNLAAQSFVASSFNQPLHTGDVDGLGVLRCLEAVRQTDPNIKYYQASSSEMFGKVQTIPQTEVTPFYPRSPYGVAKLYGHWITVNYRESYNMFACSGILFNHESPLRGVEFVTRKITDGLVRIKRGLQDVLELGNLYAKRDWGFAGDYVAGMHMMLQQEKADDYVLATNTTYTIKEFIDKAVPYADFDIEWVGEGIDEQAIDKKTGKKIIQIDPKFYRPAEVDLLIGDPTKAKTQMGWEPKVSFERLVEMMMTEELQYFQM